MFERRYWLGCFFMKEPEIEAVVYIEDRIVVPVATAAFALPIELLDKSLIANSRTS